MIAERSILVHNKIRQSCIELKNSDKIQEGYLILIY